LSEKARTVFRNRNRKKYAAIADPGETGRGCCLLPPALKSKPDHAEARNNLGNAFPSCNGLTPFDL
jgi:hypothetical protein